MPTLETLAEADLKGLLYAASLRRARGYLDAVRDPVRSGQKLTANVRGSRLYEVEIELGSASVEARCTCPYDWGGYCKHIGAVLLTWIQSPGSFRLGEAVPHPPIEDEALAVTPVEWPPPHLPPAPPGWMTTTFEERQVRWNGRLEEWLSGLRMADLRRVVKNRGWAIKGARKADLVQAVAARLADTEEMDRVVSKLDEDHRRILAALSCLCSGPFWPQDLQCVAQVWGVLRAHKQASTYAQHLCEVGLALPGQSAGNPQGPVDLIPFTLARHLPSLLDNLAGDLPSDAPASGLRLADPFALVRAANLLTRQLEQSPEPLRPPMSRPRLGRLRQAVEGWDYDPAELLRADPEGRLERHAGLSLSVPPPARLLPDEAIARLAPALGGETRLEFILRLLLEAGIFMEGSPLTVWQEARARFLQLDDLAQRALLARSFVQLSDWSALWEVIRADDGLQLLRGVRFRYQSPEHLRIELELLRQRVLWVLATLPEGRWVALADLLRLMRDLWPRVDPILGNATRLPHSVPTSTASVPCHLARKGLPLSPDGASEWDLVQGNYVRQLLTGPLHWLGLADLCVDDGALVSFRLHGLADLFWDRVQAPAAPPHVGRAAAAVDAAQAVAVDDLSICVDPAAVSAQAHSLLDQISRLDLVEADRFIYRLDPRAACQAFEAGSSLDELLDGWQRLLQVPMPEQILTLLSRWWDAYGQVRIYEALAVIEFGDDYALAEMKAVTSLEEHLYAEVSPRLVIVRSEALPQLTVELENAGYTPRQAGDQ